LTGGAAACTLPAMPAARTAQQSVYLVAGSDEFSVKETAARLATELTPAGAGEFGLEIVEGDAPNQDAALKVLGRLHEALHTVGFFSQKLVWLKNTSLLADNPTNGTEEVKDALAALADTMKRGLPEGVTLLISAVGLDRRRSIGKVLEKMAAVKTFDAPDPAKPAGEEEIAAFIEQRLATEAKRFGPGATEVFRDLVEPNLRALAAELEKLSLYVGKRVDISVADVRAVCSPSRQAVIWELTDTIGGRNLPAALRALENLLTAGQSPIGLVMMLAGQFRLMLLARDLGERRVLVPGAGRNAMWEYGRRFQALPDQEKTHFPRTKEGAPPSPWRMARCAEAARQFSTAELVAGLGLLLEAHVQLVSTQLDARLVLEQLVVRLAQRPAAGGGSAGTARG